MHLPRNRTSWDKYMLKDISKYKFYGRSQLVRLRGKYTVQTAHCAVEKIGKSEKKTGRFVPNLHVVHDGKGHDKDGNK